MWLTDLVHRRAGLGQRRLPKLHAGTAAAVTGTAATSLKPVTFPAQAHGQQGATGFPSQHTKLPYVTLYIWVLL